MRQQRAPGSGCWKQTVTRVTSNKIDIETEGRDRHLLAPILITPSELAKPIIGFNVIEELVQANTAQ